MKVIHANDVNPTRWLVAACSALMALGVAQSSVAQQTLGNAAAMKNPLTATEAAPSTINDYADPLEAPLPPAGISRPAAKPVTDEEEESPKAHKPAGNGIRIHGHWVLQVKNADGTLGERREFENSLVTTFSTYSGAHPLSSSGSELMVAILTGNLTVGDPGIGFVQGNITGDPSTLCLPSDPYENLPYTCYVYTSTNSLWSLIPSATNGGFESSSTGLQYVANFSPQPSIVLSGNYLVPAGLTSIAAVQSLYGLCAPFGSALGGLTYLSGVPAGFSDGYFTLQNSASFRNANVTPLDCIAANSAGASDHPAIGALTSTPVGGGPMSVTPGKVVEVTVTITFS